MYSRNTQLQQYDYLTIDPKLLNRSGSEVDETSINATKDKIKRLINERNKTLELYHSSIPVGGLDDDHVKDFEPKFYGKNLIIIVIRKCETLYKFNRKVTKYDNKAET